MPTSCIWAVCKHCDNNVGGVCAYDHAAEFPQGCAPEKYLGLDADVIANDEQCRLFDPIE